MLKPWQYALSWLIQIVLASFCVHLCVSPSTKIAGDRGDLFSHRTFQLAFSALTNVASCLLLWKMPKRQIFVFSMVGSFLVALLAFDTIWSCSYIHFTVGLLGTLVVVVLTGILR
jgi:hypothetical protein